MPTLAITRPPLTEADTSKYHAAETLLGRNGTFLASLAAMSLLTITSHHHQHRSHNSVTFHHSKAIERLCPAPAHRHIHDTHGTRVTVRNLFGNLPVRVKQRAAVLEQKTEQDRVWDVLKRDVVRLLLSWQGSVSLKIRDASSKTVVNLNATTSNAAADGDASADIGSRSARLTAMLNVLTQAGYISVDAWSSWVPVAASTPVLSIKGAISLDPAPTKHAQFLSLGIEPVLAESGNNELYDEINRLFALSSFGTVEETSDVHDLEKLRHRTDKRFKSDGYTIRQLRVRKDIDRHPMFHLRIVLNGNQSSTCTADKLGNESILQATLEVLGAMVTQWLSAHHFRPQQRRGKRDRPSSASTDLRSIANVETIPTAESSAAILQSRNQPPQTADSNSRSAKKLRLEPVRSCRPSDKSQGRVFAEWSRIKSGKANFFHKAPSLPDPKSASESVGPKDNSDLQNPNPAALETSAGLHVGPISQGALSLGKPNQNHGNEASTVQSSQIANDDTILWTDPLTKKTYLLNARTGCVVPERRSRPNTTSMSSGPGFTQKSMNKSLRLPRRPATTSAVETPWLTSMLHSWDNPIFKPSERRIQHVEPHEPDIDQSHCRHHCSRIDMDKSFNQVAADAKMGKLSKDDLRHAEVIAQVDKKFVLTRMNCPSSSPTLVDDYDDLLVLIDQHAADERIQVEHLFRQLCTPVIRKPGLMSFTSNLGFQSQVASTLLHKPLQFTVSQIERTHFFTYAVRFAAWGILYDVSETRPPQHQASHGDESRCLLSVTALPPAVMERCKADPKLLIAFLRSSVWKYVDDLQHLPPLASHHGVPTMSTPASDLEEKDESDWVRRLATCPPGLVDLVNSRACRSAIMFNDELDVEQCRRLVQKLAECVFPFMCAHGRPSIVPLVGLGRVCGGGQQGCVGSGLGEGEEEGFMAAWTRWQG